MTKKNAATKFILTRKSISVLFVAIALLVTIAANPVYSLNATTTTVTPGPTSSVTIGNTITFTATVKDTSLSPTNPTTTVGWDDGGAGGAFSVNPCTLVVLGSDSGTCTTDYTPPSVATTVTITAKYAGDGTHSPSSGTSALTVNLRSTSVTVSLNPSTVIIGNTITYTVTVADISSGSASTPTGTVSWSDGAVGGTFSLNPCTLASGACTTVYTPPSTPGPVTITATYSGDPTHAGNSGTSSLTVLTPAQATQNLINLIGSMNLAHGLANSLDAKLKAAIKSLNRGNPIPAKNQLQAFLNEVNAKCCNKPPAKPLTTIQANLLIADAQEIIQAIP